MRTRRRDPLLTYLHHARNADQHTIQPVVLLAQDVRLKLAPGATVVIIDPREPNLVTISNNAYDTRVAGVVSLKPGLLLGEGGEHKTKVAHSGRAKLKVDSGYGAVAIGDLLVTSPTPGYAMRSQPVDVGGVTIHRPGTLIGKALEPLQKGRGEILVLLMLQ